MPDYNSFRQLESSVTPTPLTVNNAYPTLTTSEIASNGRFPIYNYEADNEDIYGRNQSTIEQWRNGALKFLGTTAGTFAGSTVGLVNGLYKWIDDGKLSSFYDNEFNQGIDNIYSNMENSLPNYQTQEQRNAGALSPGTWFTANFWADTILKNAGFAAGTILSGGIWSKAISPFISGISRGVANGSAAEIAAITQDAALTGKNIAEVNLRIGQILKNSQQLTNGLNQGYRATLAGLATTGEASMEALNATKNYRDKLIENYRNTYGQLPEGESLEDIEVTAEKVGNITFGANLALLTATNYIQFPKLLGKMWTGARAEAVTAERSIGRITTEGDNVLNRSFAVARPNRVLNTLKGYSTMLSESFEEGAQYAIPISVQDWIEKGKSGDQSILNSLSQGIKETLSSKEGQLSILAGGITGGILGKAGDIVNTRSLRPGAAERRAQLERTNSFVRALNETQPNSYLQEGIESLNRFESLNRDLSKAAASNDRLAFEDAKTDSTLAYLLPRIQYGRMDLIKQDLIGYEELAQSPEGWEQLQAQGIAPEYLTSEQFIDNINKIQQTAQYVNDQFEALNLRYGTAKKIDGSALYQPKTILQLAYTSSKINDYNQRIDSLLPLATEAGIVIIPFLNSAANRTLEASDIESLIAQVDNSSLTFERKVDVKEGIADMLEMTVRRQSRIEEYEQIVKNPQIYEATTTPLVEEESDPLDIVPTPEGISVEQTDAIRDLANKITSGEELTEEEKQLQDANQELLQQYLDILRPPLSRVKQQFLEANQDTEFQMDVNGTPQTGILSIQDDRLYFNYGDLQTEISNQDFQDGTIQGEVQDPSNYLLTSDPRTEVLPQGRILRRAQGLLQVAQERNNQVQQQLQEKQKEVERITQEIRNEGTTRYFTRNMVEDMMTLQEMRQEVEDEIQNLQIENQALERVIEEYQQIIDSKPRSLQHQIDLIEDQQTQLQVQAVNNGLLQTALTNLLASSTDLLSRLGRKVMSKVYSWRRNLAGQPAFQTMQRAMEIYEQDPTQGNLQQALQTIQVNTELITNLDSKPLTEGERKWIIDKLQQIQNDLSRVEPILQAKQQVQQELQNIQEDIDTREELFQDNEPDNFVETEEVSTPIPEDDQIADLQRQIQELPNQGIIVVDNEASQERIDLEKEIRQLQEEKTKPQETFPEDNARVPLSILPDATVIPQEQYRKEGWYLRFSNFLNVLSTMTPARRSQIRAVTVTKATEDSQGLPGFIDMYNTDSQGNPVVATSSSDAPITLVLQEIKADGTKVFLDEKGNETSDPTKMVITKKRSAKVTWSNGQPNYSKGTPEEAQAVLLEWQPAREQEVNSPTPREYTFRVSGGREETGKKVPIVGNLITSEQVQTEKVLTVVGSKGVPEANAKSGDVLLKTEDTLQKLYKRNLTDKEYQTIQGTLLHIAKIAKQTQEKTTDNKVTNLINYLQGITSLSLGGDNYSTFKAAGNKMTLSQEKIEDPSFIPALRTNLITTDVNRELLEKNQPFTEVVGFEENGTPLLKIWNSYQEFILNSENPLLDGYNKVDRYLVLNQKVGSQSRTQEVQLVPIRKPKQPKTPSGEDKNLKPQDKVTYTDQRLKTPAGKDVTISGNFTVLITKSSGQDTFIDPQGNRINIPQGVNVVRLNGTNEIYYLTNTAHNRTQNKKSYKTSNVTPQEFEVEDILPSSDPIMETESEIPQEVVAIVNEEQSVLQGTTITLPKIEKPKNPTPKEQVKLPKPNNLAELAIGDKVQLTTRSGNTETIEVLGFKGDKTTVRVITTNPQGEVLKEEEYDSRKGSVITKEILRKKQENLIPVKTIPEILPSCE